MNTRWFLVVLALIGTTLACNLPGLNPGLNLNNPTPTDVISVAVNPPSGTGSFTLEVTYFAFTDRDRLPEPITCYYVTPFGAMMPIGSVTPPGGIISEGGTALTDILDFSVSEPGDYTATCENNSSTSKASAVFGVTGTGTNQPSEPTPTDQPQPTQQQEQVAFTINGTFNLTWPDTAGHPGEYTSGEIQANIDPKTGLATGSLRGSGSGTMEVRHGDHFHTVQWNYSYTALSLTGSIDPLTGMLTLNGTADAKYNWVGDTCDVDEWGIQTCMSTSPDGQFPVTITGTVNLANHTGSGKVDATQNPDYPYLGEWQTTP